MRKPYFSLALAAIVAMALSVPALAATAAMTITEYTSGSVKVVVVAWTGNSSVRANATTASAYSGQVLAFRNVPSSTAPANGTVGMTAYDVTGQDALLGRAWTMSNTTAAQVNGTQTLPVNGRVTFRLSRPIRGSGTSYFYVR